MSNLVQSDIFFFITGMSVIMLTAIFAIILVYVAYVMRNLKQILDTAKRETDLIAEDINQLRTNVKEEGMKVKSFIGFVESIINRKKTNKK